MIWEIIYKNKKCFVRCDEDYLKKRERIVYCYFFLINYAFNTSSLPLISAGDSKLNFFFIISLCRPWLEFFSGKKSCSTIDIIFTIVLSCMFGHWKFWLTSTLIKLIHRKNIFYRTEYFLQEWILLKKNRVSLDLNELLLMNL